MLVTASSCSDGDTVSWTDAIGVRHEGEVFRACPPSLRVMCGDGAVRVVAPYRMVDRALPPSPRPETRGSISKEKSQ